MSKWIETITAVLVRWDNVVKIDFECNENDRYYSYIHMKDGSKLDFLEVPDVVMYQNKEYKMDCELLTEFHRDAIFQIENTNHTVVDVDKIFKTDHVFQSAMINYLLKQEKQD